MTRQRVNKVITELEEFTARLLQKVTLNITSNLQEDTPVDTGWARANWVPSIGSPFRGLAGSRKGVINNALTERGKSLISTSYTLDKGAIYISNNVPYIVNLNEGSSTKAPAAFIQAAIVRGVKQSK